MTFNWGDVKAEIERLYMREGKSLDDVRDILKTTRNFNPSLRAYKNKLDEWGYVKYNRRQKGTAAASVDLTVLAQDLGIVQITEVASVLLAGSESEAVRISLTQIEHELEAHASDAREQRMILGKLSRKRRRQDLDPDEEEVNHSLNKVAKLETSLSQMRKSLAQGMTSVSVQTSGPTGFASCWKQEPMTLEDAHGKLLPLPVELVVSWEMLDSILLSHFRTLAGEKKVQKGEFEIEDGLSRGKLVRTHPWSQISKPGRKIEMSMVFKDSSKTSVVCPKCGTISNEKKGVQVEWRVDFSNPDCNMIFRTEDDERPIAPSLTTVRDRPTRQTMQRSSMNRNEVEDSPGMFKRVIIRLRSVRLNNSDHGFGTSGVGLKVL